MHMNLKPAVKNGITLKVHNPATKLFLENKGSNVFMSTYWRRRLACGDVVKASIEHVAKVTKENKKQDKKINKVEA